MRRISILSMTIALLGAIVGCSEPRTWSAVYFKYYGHFNIDVEMEDLQEIEEIQEDIFDLYFPWNEKSHKIGRDSDTAFMEFLRISLSRPRDILVIIVT